MQCPECKLRNPPRAQRCDCGYDFASGEVRSSYVGVRSRPADGNVTVAILAGLAMIVASIGLSVASGRYLFVGGVVAGAMLVFRGMAAGLCS